MQWNAKVNSDRQAALGAAMGKTDCPPWQAIRELIAGLGLPCTLRDVGIGPANLTEIAERALSYAPVRQNPRSITSVHDVLEILELCS